MNTRFQTPSVRPLGRAKLSRAETVAALRTIYRLVKLGKTPAALARIQSLGEALK